MIVRSPDTARDANDMLKKPEAMQDFQAMHSKMTDAHDQKRVAKASESELDKLNVDKDGSGGGGHGGESEGSGGSYEDEEPGTLVSPSNNMIDIMV